MLLSVTQESMRRLTARGGTRAWASVSLARPLQSVRGGARGRTLLIVHVVLEVGGVAFKRPADGASRVALAALDHANHVEVAVTPPT